MTIYSKKNDLLNYFIHDNRLLSKEYVKSVKSFLSNEIKNNQPKTKQHNPIRNKIDQATLNYLKNKVIK